MLLKNKDRNMLHFDDNFKTPDCKGSLIHDAVHIFISRFNFIITKIWL